jgi:cysteine-S-conjugate beta-lyase
MGIIYNFDEIIERRGSDCVKYDLLEPLFGKKDLLPFWVADMDFRTPDFIREAVKKRADHPIYGYTIKPEAYFQSIIEWIKKRYKWEIQQDWLSFSPGVVPALNLAIMAFTKPGDKIVVQPPVYFPFFSAVKNNHREIVYNQLLFSNGKYEVDLDDLERKARDGARMLILSHPHNPVGRSWSAEELKGIAEVCMRNGMLVLSDEIHSDLMLQGRKHTPLASLGDEFEKRTITCMAPSKTFNLAGLATSFLVIPDGELRAKYDETLEQVHVGMGNLFGTIALQAAYEKGEEWLGQLLAYLDQNLELFSSFLKDRIPAVNIIQPEATYMVWMDFRATGLDSKELRHFLVHKAGIALNEGGMFGPGGDGFMRWNIGCPRQTLLKGLEQLESAFKG